MLLLRATCGLLAGLGWAFSYPRPARAQAAPDSGGIAARHWLLKGGLALPRLRYSRPTTGWQLLVPVALGLEHRLSARYSLYGQFDADWQLGSAARRRGAGRVASTLPTVAVGVGGRYYYAQPAGPALVRPGRPELGRYLALEAGTTLQQAAATTRRSSYGAGAVLTPSLYALWGVQNRLRPHLLYDVSLGLGVLAPTRAASEQPLPLTRHGWDVGLQANVRLYLAN